MKASSRIWVGEVHKCLVEEDPPVDNFSYLDAEFGFRDMDLVGSSAKDLCNLEVSFCIVELVLDKQEEVLGSLTAC